MCTREEVTDFVTLGQILPVRRAGGRTDAQNSSCGWGGWGGVGGSVRGGGRGRGSTSHFADKIPSRGKPIYATRKSVLCSEDFRKTTIVRHERFETDTPQSPS